VKTLADGLDKVFGTIDLNLNDQSNVGFPTGFAKLDADGGLHEGDLVIVAAETSQGKTSLALAFARAGLSAGYPVAFYSMEMTMEQLAARLLSIQTGVPSSSILYKALSIEQIDRCDAWRAGLNNLPLFVDESSTANIDGILASIRRLHIKHNIKAVVVDYLQILNVNNGGRNRTDEQFMGDVARKLKDIAKELGIVVIALSQLSKNLQNPLPTIGRLRSSGQIAEAADMVILLYRPEAIKNGQRNTYPEPFENKDTHNSAEIIVAKNRHAGLMEFLCGFNPACTLFYDTPIGTLSQSQYDEPLF